jgi:hypothetical protein
VYDVVREPGRSLPTNVQAFMGARLGHDFSGVRVHTDGRAAESARAVDAAAYTVGNHVVLGHDDMDLTNATDRYLIAHELAHVAQQEPGMGRAQSLALGARSDAVEDHADGAARTVASGGRAVVHGRSSGAVLRRAGTPTGIKLAAAKPFGHADLKDDTLKEKFRTYLGSATLMQVTPKDNYKGHCTKEYLTEVSNTCPASFSVLKSCTGNKCLDFDRYGSSGDAGTGKMVTDGPDSFADLHRTRVDKSLLEGTGKSACSIVCHQGYKYDRKDPPLGAFYIIRNFRASTFTPKGAKAPLHITTGDIQKVAAPTAAPSAEDFAKKDAPDLKKRGLLTNPPPVPKAPPPAPKAEKK